MITFTFVHVTSDRDWLTTMTKTTMTTTYITSKKISVFFVDDYYDKNQMRYAVSSFLVSAKCVELSFHQYSRKRNVSVWN